MLEIVAAATEFDSLPVRPGEEESVRRLLAHAVLAPPEGSRWSDPHTKANALLQAHFSRTPLAGAWLGRCGLCSVLRAYAFF
jgi:pre-mRNA-splicing helicase BRR2